MLYQDKSPRDIPPEIPLLLVLSYLLHMIDPVMCSQVLGKVRTPALYWFHDIALRSVLPISSFRVLQFFMKYCTPIAPIVF